MSIQAGTDQRASGLIEFRFFFFACKVKQLMLLSLQVYRVTLGRVFSWATGSECRRAIFLIECDGLQPLFPPEAVVLGRVPIVRVCEVVTWRTFILANVSSLQVLVG